MVFVYITIALAVGVAGGWFLNKFIVTKRLGDADTLARRIVLEARKEAQAQKKEIILQGKDDLFNQKREQENEFRDREREIKARERKLEDFGTRLEEKAEKLDAGLTKVNVTLENQVVPRVRTIESCYLSTYERYQSGAGKMDSLEMDVDIIKKVVSEHSKKLEKLA